MRASPFCRSGWRKPCRLFTWHAPCCCPLSHERRDAKAPGWHRGVDRSGPLLFAQWSKLKVSSLVTGRTGMKTRSALEICLPLALFIAACALSLPTLLLAIAWMTIGVISLGHRTLESFPTNGIRRKWLRGYRGACMMFYHLAWWPWYMRTPLRDGADRAAGRLCHLARRRPERA